MSRRPSYAAVWSGVYARDVRYLGPMHVSTCMLILTGQSMPSDKRDDIRWTRPKAEEGNRGRSGLYWARVASKDGQDIEVRRFDLGLRRNERI